MDLIKEFWNKAVSGKQSVDRSFINELNEFGGSFDEKVDNLCVLEMTNPETGEKKFAHINQLNRCVYFDDGPSNYDELLNICSDMFIKNFEIGIDNDCYYGDTGKEIEKFFTDNFTVLEKYLDTILVPDGYFYEYALKDEDFDLWIPDAFYKKKNLWIGLLMNHCYKFDDDKCEYIDEIEEKSYDENGHFEYYTDEYGDYTPPEFECWVQALFLIMVSYYSIRKVKFTDAFPDFDEQRHMDGYIHMKDYDDVSVLDSLINKHIKTFSDIETMIQEYRKFIYSCGMEDDYSKYRKEFIEMLEENKPNGTEFKTIMKWQNSDIKKWICECLVRTFED